MFAIAIELLAGRYTATQFNDRSAAEWPPHPARLYSAMVAAWADADEPDPAGRAALRWLEGQGAPAIHCDGARQRTVVTHFVPVNDPTALTRDLSRAYETVSTAEQELVAARQSGNGKAVQRAEAALWKAEKKATDDAAKAGLPTGKESASIADGVLAVLPEFRGKQGRTYPTVIPGESTVWFVWPDAQPSEQDRQALDAVLGRVGRIGHSSTLVACRCADSGPDGQPRWVPAGSAGSVGEIRLRVPRSGLLDRLERAHEMHQGEEPRTLPAGMVGYGSPRRERVAPRRPLLGGDWYVLGFKARRDPGWHAFPVAFQALPVARAVRQSLLKHSGQPPHEILSGHLGVPGASGSTPPLDAPHLAVVPLLNAGHRHSDGRILGVALVLPRDCPGDGREAVERALLAWGRDDFELYVATGAMGRSGKFEMEELGVDRAAGEHEPEWLRVALEGRRATSRRDFWCQPARRWLTVTPIALDRFPGNLRSPVPEARDRAEAAAELAVAQACVYAGLAEGPGDVTVTVRLDAPLAGLPASPASLRPPGQRRFPGYATGRGAPRACVHAEIEFPRPVEGPVLVGAGRFLGYGLCLPVPGLRERRAGAAR